MKPRKVNASHGIVCRKPGEKFGCFAWPTVARMDDGTLAVACSGLRSQHVCPWGKTVLSVSRDNGASWSEPRVIQDSMIDDRDAGIVHLGGGKLLVSWFRSDTRQYALPVHEWMPREWVQEWADADAFADWTDEKVNALLGSWVMLSDDAGETWDHDWILRDDAPGDVGYPATVELADGSLFSVYYQQAAPDEKCSILWSKWRLPA